MNLSKEQFKPVDSKTKHGKDGKGADEKMAEELLWMYPGTAFHRSLLVNES